MSQTMCLRLVTPVDKMEPSCHHQSRLYNKSFNKHASFVLFFESTFLGHFLFFNNDPPTDRVKAMTSLDLFLFSFCLAP